MPAAADSRDSYDERDAGDPERADEARCGLSEQIAGGTDRNRPGDATECVPDEEGAPAHVMSSGEPGADDAKAREPACQEHGFRPVTLEEALAMLEEATSRVEPSPFTG